MRIDPIYVWNHLTSADNRESLVVRSKNPVLAKVMEERRNQLQHPQNQDSNFPERIASESRVIVVEGISGSGKDTFQNYLRVLIKDRDVYDYSEGELLQSWNQLEIGGIFNLRVKFMKLFVNYIKERVSRDKNAVFLLNRFHLSAYVMTVLQQPRLQKEYDEIIDILRTLPVHVFILQLNENEIEQRSLHPERSRAWQKFQQQIVKKEGFRDRVERYLWQQQLMLEAAERQQIPYSVIMLPSSPKVEGTQARASETRSVLRRGAPTNVSDGNPPQRKRGIPRSL